MNSPYAFTVIEETHEAWKRLCDPAAGNCLQIPQIHHHSPPSVECDRRALVLVRRTNGTDTVKNLCTSSEIESIENTRPFVKNEIHVVMQDVYI